MKYIVVALLLLLAPALHAQETVESTGNDDHVQSIYQWEQHYKEEHLADPRSPVKAEDTGYLRFFEPSGRYKVIATFTLTPKAKPFEIATHSGKTKPYRQYGLLTFSIGSQKCSLQVYQGIELIKQEALKDYLFIPFNDLTNYASTFGGGRYIDLKLGDIKDGKVVLDFNKAYNPYCAFGEGYSCPIPPDANKLPIAIEAGEMVWSKPEKN